MVGYLSIVKKVLECFAQFRAASLENVFNFLANLFGKKVVKFGTTAVYIYFKIQLDREIGEVFSGECCNGALEESRLARLSWCKDDNVAPLFDALDELSEFFRASDNIVLLWVHGTLRTKPSHLCSFFTVCADF